MQTSGVPRIKNCDLAAVEKRSARENSAAGLFLVCVARENLGFQRLMNISDVLKFHFTQKPRFICLARFL